MVCPDRYKGCGEMASSGCQAGGCRYRHAGDGCCEQMVSPSTTMAGAAPPDSAATGERFAAIITAAMRVHTVAGCVRPMLRRLLPRRLSPRSLRPCLRPWCCSWAGGRGQLAGAPPLASARSSRPWLRPRDSERSLQRDHSFGHVHSRVWRRHFWHRAPENCSLPRLRFMQSGLWFSRWSL